MGKRWVLDTETKGTGAQMVPLETKSPSASPAPVSVRSKPRAATPAEPRLPPRFKVVDAVSRQVLAEGVDTRGAVDVLAGLRSVVDVSVYLWDEKADRWRVLSYGERKKLWSFRGR